MILLDVAKLFSDAAALHASSCIVVNIASAARSGLLVLLHAETGNTAARLRDQQRSNQPLAAICTAAWGDALCTLAWPDRAMVLEAIWRTEKLEPLAVYSIPEQVSQPTACGMSLVGSVSPAVFHLQPSADNHNDAGDCCCWRLLCPARLLCRCVWAAGLDVHRHMHTTATGMGDPVAVMQLLLLPGRQADMPLQACCGVCVLLC